MSTMTAQELNAAVAAWQKGAMSRDTLFELLRRGEILPEGRTNEQEARLVGAEKPVEPAPAIEANKELGGLPQGNSTIHLYKGLHLRASLGFLILTTPLPFFRGGLSL